jgi:hypothetical protein
MGLIYREPAEQLGDTTPGALDTLPPLEEHPAVLAAREATALPSWARWALPGVVLLSLLCSAIWPLGWAPPL